MIYVTLTLAQKPPTTLTTLEKAVEAARQKYHIPGLSLAIVQGDKIVYAKGFGLRDIAKKLPATPDTLYCIASSTKAFTATTLLMAADAGKLSLSDSPRQYLPYFHLRDPDADARITLADLLCHRSGVPRTDFLLLASEGILNRKELIQAVGQAKPTAKLGAKFQYQNILFAAAGEVSAIAFGKPYEAVVEERIFQKLGMKRSNLSVPKTLQDPDHATGYDPASQKPLAWRSLEATAPAVAINSSANEMALWVRELLEGGKSLLKPESFAAMTHQQIEMAPTHGYGYGWMLHKWKGTNVVEHSGNIDGFNAEVALLPEKKLGFVMLSNVSDSPMASEIQEIVWRNLGGESTLKPIVPAPSGKPELPLDLFKGGTKTFQPPLSVDALLAKMVEAVGGESNLKKHRSRVEEITVDFENQGMTGTGTVYAEASGRQTKRIDLFAVGKKIGSINRGFDGKLSWQSLSFLPPSPPTKSERARAETSFNKGLLDAKHLFRAITITGVEMISETSLGIAPQECLVLRKTTKSGESLTEYVSTKTYRVVRRDASFPEFFTDYQESEGVCLPFKSIQKHPSMGTVVTTIQRIHWDIPVDPRVFTAPR